MRTDKGIIICLFGIMLIIGAGNVSAQSCSYSSSSSCIFNCMEVVERNYNSCVNRRLAECMYEIFYVHPECINSNNYWGGDYLDDTELPTFRITSNVCDCSLDECQNYFNYSVCDQMCSICSNNGYNPNSSDNSTDTGGGGGGGGGGRGGVRKEN